MRIKKILSISFFYLTFIYSTYGMHEQSNLVDAESLLLDGAYLGEIDSVKFALIRGITVNQQNRYGSTALLMASHRGHKDIVKFLLYAKADPNIYEHRFNHTPLILAAQNLNEDIVKLLLEAKADPNKQDQNGFSALMTASIMSNENMIKILLDNKADFALRTKNNETVFDIAKKYKNIEEILKEEAEKQRQLIKKEVCESTILIPEIVDIVSEYVVYPKEQKSELDKIARKRKL